MSDMISRQTAIDALKICDNNEDGINCHKCPLRDERWDGAWQDDETNCYTKLMRDSAKLLELAEPEPKKGEWINKFFYGIGEGSAECSICHKRTSGYKEDTGWSVHCLFYDFCPKCGSDNREEKRNE